MIIKITNISTMTAIVKINNKSVELHKNRTISFCDDCTSTIIGIYPKMNTSYSHYASKFVVLTEYKIDNGENVSLNIDYQRAKVKVEANHTYYRFAETSGQFKAFYSILPEEKSKNKRGLEFLLNIPLTLAFEGMGILALSTIVGLVTESLKKAIITFLICLVAVSLYEVIENIFLDRLFNGLKKRFKLIKETETPLFFEICTNSDYIAYCFGDLNQ